MADPLQFLFPPAKTGKMLLDGIVHRGSNQAIDTRWKPSWYTNNHHAESRDMFPKRIDMYGMISFPPASTLITRPCGLLSVYLISEERGRWLANLYRIWYI